jgi:tRNA 2-(methylsulfanyl)-N6-isopentenyladenosine37 hydroxylase
MKRPNRSARSAALVGDETSPLLACTPASWVEAAAERIPELLVDHANCEKKAASTALALIFAYPEDRALAVALSKLAREELKHFEQVDRLMRELEVPFVRQKPGRYAAELRRCLHSREPRRKLDLLLVSALIEARSCERFDLLAERLPTTVAGLYAGLRESEARHFERYLRFAESELPGEAWRPRLEELAAVEAELATTPDRDFRFHSGPPSGAR